MFFISSYRNFSWLSSIISFHWEALIFSMLCSPSNCYSLPSTSMYFDFNLRYLFSDFTLLCSESDRDCLSISEMSCCYRSKSSSFKLVKLSLLGFSFSLVDELFKLETPRKIPPGFETNEFWCTECGKYFSGEFVVTDAEECRTI